MARPTRQLIHSVKRATGIRLTVFLPLFLMGVVFAVWLWAIRLTTISFGKSSLTQLPIAQVQAVRETAFLVIGIGGGAALLSGVILAIAIGRPIRVFLAQVERLLPASVPPSDSFDHLPEGVLVVSPAGEILRANAEAQRIFGSGPNGLLGTRLSDLLEHTQAENGLLLALWRTTVDRTPPTTFPHLTLQRKDGRRLEVRGSLTLAEPAGSDGGEVILTVQDLASARTIQGEVRWVDQLAALGALGASVVHEIGGAVLAIQTLVDLIAPQFPKESPDHRYLEKIQEELDRIRRSGWRGPYLTGQFETSDLFKDPWGQPFSYTNTGPTAGQIVSGGRTEASRRRKTTSSSRSRFVSRLPERSSSRPSSTISRGRQA